MLDREDNVHLLKIKPARSSEMVVLGVVLRITIRLAIWQHTGTPIGFFHQRARLYSPYGLCVHRGDVK